MIDHAGVVLWASDAGSHNINGLVSTLRAYGVPRVCVAATNVISQSGMTPAIATVYDPMPVGSFTAAVRAFVYCQTNFTSKDISDKGMLLIYSTLDLKPKMLGKMFQIATLAGVQPIDAFVMVQITEGEEKTRCSLGFNGQIDKVFKSKRGHEPSGLFYFTKKFLKELPKIPCRTMSEFLEWCIVHGKNLYAVINTCQQQ